MEDVDGLMECLKIVEEQHDIFFDYNSKNFVQTFTCDTPKESLEFQAQIQNTIELVISFTKIIRQNLIVHTIFYNLLDIISGSLTFDTVYDEKLILIKNGNMILKHDNHQDFNDKIQLMLNQLLSLIDKNWSKVKTT